MEDMVAPVLESSMSILEASAIGSSPYEIIKNVAHSCSDIGDKISKMVASVHVLGKPSVACIGGCNHCCHLSSSAQTGQNAKVVGMTLLDGVILLEHFVNIRHSHIAIRSIETMNKIWNDLPKTLDRQLCPFDEAGNCAVYAVRPLVCRLYFSNNATHCAVQADIPANEGQVDTLIAAKLRPIRHSLTANAAQVLKSKLPGYKFGYFDFMTTAYKILNAVSSNQEDALRSEIDINLAFLPPKRG